MNSSNFERLVPMMKSWDTRELEEAFIAFCIDAIELNEQAISLVHNVVSLVNEDWFVDRARRLIYTVIKKTILDLDGNGFAMPGSIAIKVDAMIMAGVIQSSITAEEIISNARTSSSLFLGTYSHSVLVNSVIPLWRIKLIRRELRSCAELMVDSLDRQPDPDVLLNKIPQLLEKQQSIWNSTCNSESQSENWQDTIDELLQPLPSNNSVSTGISILDHTIQGGISGLNSAYGGRLIVIAARPGMGKTTLAVTLATHLADTGNDVIFFSLEMPRRQIEYKAISCLDFLRMKGCGKIVDPIRMFNLQQRRYSESQAERLKALGYDAFVKRLLVFDASQDIFKLTATIRVMAKTKPNLRGIFIDYLQLVDGCTGTDNDAIAIGVVTKALKRVAVETGIDIILMSQVNRGVEQRSEKMPTLADLRGSGCIEQDADIVMFMFRPGYYDNENADPYELAISVAKNRNGITGTLQCKIDLASSVVFDRL